MWYLTAMPNETDTKTGTAASTTTPAPAAAPDTRDAKIADLKKQVDALTVENASLKARPKAPAGDHCVLGGKTYDVAGLVAVRDATDEGRKGNIDLEGSLVILKR